MLNRNRCWNSSFCTYSMLSTVTACILGSRGLWMTTLSCHTATVVYSPKGATLHHYMVQDEL